MKPALLCVIVLIAAAPGSSSHAAPSPPATRARAMLARMSLDDKLAMVHGNNTLHQADFNRAVYVGYLPGNARLGIPALTMNDGPQGFRAPPV